MPATIHPATFAHTDSTVTTGLRGVRQATPAHGLPWFRCVTLTRTEPARECPPLPQEWHLNKSPILSNRLTDG
ncbi:hypothetical protein K9N68_21680 [Kovacikia minuta CCNUW1]|uniref:hypothetical protein n=1 Tax=Kovacikia minuta TaxID=2931930 RepID=UPI001CCE1448|nr:hypothetical protein [Kovacikia minuta]UBF24301.1 hypothetical protein K9N68_21680 [Kovacikia minuta CCNUW1]